MLVKWVPLFCFLIENMLKKKQIASKLLKYRSFCDTMIKNKSDVDLYKTREGKYMKKEALYAKSSGFSSTHLL